MSAYDTWESNLYGLPYPIYFYYYSRTQLENPDRDSAVLGNCSAILSVQFTPFINSYDLNINTLSYDTKRFGSLDKVRPELDFTPLVHRVNSIKPDKRVKVVGTFEIYKTKKDTGAGKTRYWGNESRLYNYPYSFAMLNDGLNSPLEIKYHLCPKQPSAIVKVRNTLSDRCSYGFFVEGYKGDGRGGTEAMVSGDAHELPCSSSAYSQWYASSKNTHTQMVKNQVQQSFITKTAINQQQSVNNLSAIGNAATGLNFGSVPGFLLSGLTSGIGLATSLNSNSVNADIGRTQANFDKQVAINNSLALKKDLNSTPATMISMGSDVIYGLNAGSSQLSLHRYFITTEYARKLGDYFALYGYKQNKIMKPKLRSRYFYTYIKTIGANLKSNGFISKNHLDKIKSIVDNGTTVWAIDRDGVEVGDYSMDNYEV